MIGERKKLCSDKLKKKKRPNGSESRECKSEALHEGVNQNPIWGIAI